MLVLHLTLAALVAPRSGSGAASSVTNSTELTTALLSGGAIRLMPGRYIGNFVISVDGTTLVGRDTLPWYWHRRIHRPRPFGSRRAASW